MLDSEPELVEQENSANLLLAQAAASVRSGRSLEVLLPKEPVELQASTLSSLEGLKFEVAQAAEEQLACQATKVAFQAV